MWEKVLWTGVALALLVGIGAAALGMAYEAGMLAGGEDDYLGRWPGQNVVRGAFFVIVALLFMLAGHDLGKSDAQSAMLIGKKAELEDIDAD